MLSGANELIENSRYVPKVRQELAKENVQTNATKKLFLRIPTIECEISKKTQNLLEIFEGVSEVMFFASDTKKYSRFSGKVEVSNFLLNELKSLLGEENVVFK